jgi:hypothetical protein
VPKPVACGRAHASQEQARQVHRNLQQDATTRLRLHPCVQGFLVPPRMRTTRTRTATRTGPGCDILLLTIIDTSSVLSPQPPPPSSVTPSITSPGCGGRGAPWPPCPPSLPPAASACFRRSQEETPPRSRSSISRSHARKKTWGEMEETAAFAKMPCREAPHPRCECVSLVVRKVCVCVCPQGVCVCVIRVCPPSTQDCLPPLPLLALRCCGSRLRGACPWGSAKNGMSATPSALTPAVHHRRHHLAAVVDRPRGLGPEGRRSFHSWPPE